MGNRWYIGWVAAAWGLFAICAVWLTRGGLVARLAMGEVPGWLIPAGKKGDVEVYRVVR